MISIAAIVLHTAAASAAPVEATADVSTSAPIEAPVNTAEPQPEGDGHAAVADANPSAAQTPVSKPDTAAEPEPTPAPTAESADGAPSTPDPAKPTVAEPGPQSSAPMKSSEVADAFGGPAGPKPSEPDRSVISGSELDLVALMGIDIKGVSVASNVVSDVDLQPASVTVVQRQQLRLSGARTLAEGIMLFVPGFFVVEDQDDVIAGFRGLAPDNNSKVMLLVDGQVMNTEWFWGPPDAILNSANYEWVERVEVIRGPGSVTLGQGALLGVINIVTRASEELTEDGIKPNAAIQVGTDRFLGGSAEARARFRDLTSYFHVSSTNFQGQRLRNDAWARDKANEGYLGGTVAEMGHRLMRGDNVTIMGRLGYKGFHIRAMYYDQTRDLYNFYRDRDRFSQRLTSVGAGHTLKINDKMSIESDLSFARDNFALSSVRGLNSGGTREDRLGVRVIYKAKLFKGNGLAIGVEGRNYRFGRRNRRGDNFIINNFGETTLEALPNANEERTWGFEDNLSVFSVFLEDFHTFNKYITVFGAVRFDRHPNWGSNFSPRLGAIASPLGNMHIRASYQTGFRGAPGVHYGGGFKNDGLLREENFSRIEDAEIPIYEGREIVGFQENVGSTDPERMHSIEVAFDYSPHKMVNINIVGFYNIIQNVIDVGVIWRNSAPTDLDDDGLGDADADGNIADVPGVAVPEVGSDVPGDWNGYWFFKNATGDIKQWGLEPQISVNHKYIAATLSHSTVLIHEADAGQVGSMYISVPEEEGSDDFRFKAYPQNVTRINVLAFPVRRLTLSVNYLYYYDWYSPISSKVRGNHIFNAGVSYGVTKNFELSLVGKNLFNQKRPYPMNSNAGGADLSDGSPALEGITAWMVARYAF